MNLNRCIFTKKRLIDRALDKHLPASSEYPSLIHRAIRYCVFPGGKRIRPILMLVACEGCGGYVKEAVLAACGIELIHTYTLVHDDLPSLDNDDFRRRRPTCHKKFGEAIAVLTGDALLTLGFEFLSKGNNAKRQLEIIKEVAQAIGTRGTIGGQVVDIETSKSRNTKTRVNFINLHKTAALIAVSVKIGGILAGADKKRIKVLEDFGKDIGVVFQLVDDLIDQDGYVKLVGTYQTKKIADQMARRARSRLEVFGRDFDILKALADLILNRKS